MERIVKRCAGLDLHKASVTACVRVAKEGETGEGEEPHQEIRKFAATTQGLLELRDWLASFEVELLGMEATGVYWKPVYYLLEDDFECWLPNAGHMRNVHKAGRPTQETPSGSANWSSTASLGRASWRRRRSGSLGTSLATAQGAHGRARQGGPASREGAPRGRHQALLGSLSGVGSLGAGDDRGAPWRHHRPGGLGGTGQGAPAREDPGSERGSGGSFLFSPRLDGRAHALAHIDYLEGSMAGLSTEIERVIAPFSEEVALLESTPGVARRTAETLIAEIGADMSRFPTHRHLASWAGMCPGNDESAGKRRSGKTRKGSKWLRSALTESAHAAARTKGGYLSARYASIRGRRGSKKAAVAVGHSILVICYHLLERKVPYEDLGEDYFLHNRRCSKEARTNRLVRKLERLGHKVVLEPLVQSA